MILVQFWTFIIFRRAGRVSTLSSSKGLRFDEARLNSFYAVVSVFSLVSNRVLRHPPLFIRHQCSAYSLVMNEFNSGWRSH